jgi:hypothetical protein
VWSSGNDPSKKRPIGKHLFIFRPTSEEVNYIPFSLSSYLKNEDSHGLHIDAGYTRSMRRLTPVTLLVALGLLHTSCKRKESKPPNQDPPALKKSTARPMEAIRKAPPPRRRSSARKPASVLPGRPNTAPAATPVPGPKKLLAFLTALEATGGKPFNPRPLLKKYLGKQDKSGWAGSLADLVTVKVLRVGAKPLVGGLLLFAPDGFRLCDSADSPVTVSALEFAPRKGAPYLVTLELKTEFRAGLKPKVEVPPHFKTTRAFFVNYEYDENLEGCQREAIKLGRPADSRVALLKAGRRRFVLVDSYTIYGSDGAYGQTKDTSSSLTWYPSKRAGLHYLGIVVEVTNRCVETGDDASDDEQTSFHKSVIVIGMERGKYWKYYRGSKLSRLRTQEPSLSKLPKRASGGNSTTCNP